jgi:hypothetical protein
MSETATLWAGWWRPRRGERWVRLAEADTYDTAWSLLLDAVAECRGGGDTFVGRADHPQRAA